MSDVANLQSGLLLTILRLVLEPHQCGSAIEDLNGQLVSDTSPSHPQKMET